MYPPGPMAEVDHIEIHLEDLFLGIDPLQTDRYYCFLDLSLEGLLFSEEEVPGQLLGYRACTLESSAASEINPEGPGDTDKVQPPVAVEGAVLGSDECLLDLYGDLGQRYPGPVLME